MPESKTGIKGAFRHFRIFHASLLTQVIDKQVPNVVDELERTITPNFEATTRYWNDSGENRFSKPQAKMTHIVERRIDRVVIRFNVIAWDRFKGEPSLLWHWLEGGTKDRVQRRRSPPLRERKSLRTKIGDLRSNPFPGFTGRLFVIQAGRRVRGIPPRKWYTTLADVTRREYLITHGFMITRDEIRRPYNTVLS